MERILPPRTWCILPGPDRSILFLLDQYGPQFCSHYGFRSISVILRLTTHKCSDEEPIIPYSHWLVIAIYNYWKRGVQHNPRDGTKRNGFFHHYSLNKIREYSINQLFKWRFISFHWRYVQNAWPLTEKACAFHICKQNTSYINSILSSAEGIADSKWNLLKYIGSFNAIERTPANIMLDLCLGHILYWFLTCMYLA